jgi:hypothetical protein
MWEQKIETRLPRLAVPVIPAKGGRIACALWIGCVTLGCHIYPPQWRVKEIFCET